ncbi:MAG: PAS domain S-box-containing protein [Parasphingorhabdus sp.]|jgi:PAS domain S-box-containing protein
MARNRLIHQLGTPAPAITLSIILLTASLMFTSASQQEGLFGKYYTTLLAINIGGIVLLTGLVAANIWRLLRQFRAKILGSRLTLRLIATFILLSLLPLTIVFYFAVQFLSRGIDSWFDVRIERALGDAKLVAQNTLAATTEDVIQQVRRQANLLSGAESNVEIFSLLDDFRESGEYSEMSLYSSSGRIIASSLAESGFLIPDAPGKKARSRIAQGLEYQHFEPTGDGELQLRIIVPVGLRTVVTNYRYLQVLYPLPLRLSKLGSSIQTASEEYGKMQLMRAPMKLNFILTLSLMAIMTTLIAFWIAIYSSRRMTQPLRQLAEGTRSVAQGNYKTRLEETTSDELGVLVRSFNDMTRQIQQAQHQTALSRQQVEQQRTYLESILAHLSSGVLSFDESGRLITTNETAETILGIDFSRAINQQVTALGDLFPSAEPVFAVIASHLESGSSNWREEVRFSSGRGRQTLNCRGTRIRDEGNLPGGYVIVFDDISELLQAQRNAAWGEVARRLAHEIKNPLTPIQLSAERIRHKYLEKLEPGEQETLDRATRTIVQQVESMKLMVNAFSEYAQPVQINLLDLDLNKLILDVVELHRPGARWAILTELEDNLPIIAADPVQIRQVLNNLILNTRDAVLSDSDNPKITLSTRTLTEAGRNWIQLSVSDNGPGFPIDLIDRIFDPYVTTKIKGTGLGLAIVHRIIEEHGGKIHAENDQGAVIRIRLPISEVVASVTKINNMPEQAAE